MKKIKKKELLLLLQKKANLQGNNLKGLNFSGLNLSGYELSSLDFSKAQFKKSNLKKTNFSKSILNGSCFLKANLEEANLKGADCNCADFTEANLCYTDLTQADFQNIIVYKTKMKSSNLNKARVERTDLSHTDLSNSSAKKANFKRANLNSSCLNRADFRGAILDEATLSDVTARKTIFSDCSLAKANFEGSVLDEADFSRADLTEANLRMASLERINLEGAKLKQTDFRYSRGLSEEKKQYLRQQGARISCICDRIKKILRFVFTTPWALVTFVAFLIVLGVTAYFYFSDINHLSISALHQKLRRAKQSQQLEKFLQINSVLTKKLENNGNQEGVFNRILDTARMYRNLGSKKKAIEVLEGLLENVSEDYKKIAFVQLELALAHKELGNLNTAISLLEGIEHSYLKKAFIYTVEMKLARAYWQANRYDEAADKYKRIAEEYSRDPERRSNALIKLSLVYEEMKETEKSYETISKVPWNPKNPMTFFRIQMKIASDLFKEQKYEESLIIYNKLLKNLKSRPKLINNIKSQMRVLKRKIKKKKLNESY